MKAFIVLSSLLSLLTASMLQGCIIYPYWWDDGYHRHHHDDGYRDRGSRGGRGHYDRR